MRIGLVDVDGHNYPNYALMKISAWCLPPSYKGWVTGFVGCIVVDIYGILIEKGKL